MQIGYEGQGLGTTMDATIHQDLIETAREDDDKVHFPTEDDTDESHYIYILNTILSGTARLNVLLPSATILAFTIFAPLLTNDGKCESLNRWLMGSFARPLGGYIMAWRQSVEYGLLMEYRRSRFCRPIIE
ncbi:hypothetical protein CsSME_00015304 [Camellia sinensis var. sinensis]